MFTDILSFVLIALIMTSWIWIHWLEKPIKFFSELFVYPSPDDLRFKEEAINKYIERNIQQHKEVKKDLTRRLTDESLSEKIKMR